MSKLFYVHIRVQGRKGYRDLAYVQNFVVFFFEGLPNSNARRDRTISAVAQQGANVYEEAKKAVDQLVMKVGETWVCKTCNKSTPTNCAIRKHAEIHIEGLSFPCQICGNTFRCRDTLAKHRYKKH